MGFDRIAKAFWRHCKGRPGPLGERRLFAAGAGLVGCVLSACSDNNSAVAQATDASVATDSGATPNDSGPAPSGDSGSSTDSALPASAIVAACPVSDAGAVTNLFFANLTYAGDPRLLRSDEAIFSGLNTLDDPHTQTMRLHNGGAGPVTITSVGIAPQATLFPPSYRQHSNPAAFGAAVSIPADGGADAAGTPASLPVTIAAGGDLDIEVQFLSTNTNPPSRFDNTGGEAVAALLVAQTSTDCVQAGLYGVALWNNPESISDAGVPSSNYGRYEPTLGQIIATLGYQVNVGDDLKTYLNVNQVSATAMSAPPAGDTPSDEVLIHDFVLADPSKPAVLLAPARFAPKVDYPFGWFASGALSGTSSAQPTALPPLKVPSTTDFPMGLELVATMSSVLGSDSYNSDHSEMVLPPIYGNTAGTFSPAGSFGVWCFSAQRSDGTVSFDGGVNPNVPNGDYNYSYDELNIVTQTANPALPADLAEAGVNFGVTTPVHRYRIWPLKDRVGTPIPNAYLMALEEATNDDYQDMVFTLSNVKPAPPADAGSAGDAGGD